MVEIMSHLQEYVPTTTNEDECFDPDANESVRLFEDKFHYILFGGDQLTAERATGARNERNNEDRGINRLEGLVPVVEDWHAKWALLKVYLNV